MGLSPLLSVVSTVRVPAQAKTGPATDKITYVRVDRPLAPDALKQGDIDVYIFSLTPSAQLEIGTDDPVIEFWEGVSGMDNLLLNPAPALEGELNPFSITEIRYAMNFIFDRDFIVNEIMQGTGARMDDYLGPFHPEVPSIADIKLQHGFTYDFDHANSIVERSMVLAGAEKRAGKWYYKDSPVSIKGIVRVEDERRDIGDSFASELEKLGFTVDVEHSTFGPAIEKVYGTDPGEFAWHFYTEGWGIGASRWLTWQPGCWGGSADPEVGDWCVNMPGWGVEGWWNYISPGERIDILATDINYGRYADLEDREQKVRECTDLIMKESVRIFGIRELTAYPARRDVEGLTQDISQGLRGAVWAPREAYREGATELKFANLWVWTESTTWNMYGGFPDVYSVDIVRSTYDPAVWRHPFTASAMPFRGSYEVTTEGPDGKLDVPADAVAWDADTDQWVEVGSAVNATSKIVYDYSKFTQSKWHHDIEISMADILYNTASDWDIAIDSEKSARESEVSSASAGIYGVMKGIKVVDSDKLEVYIDYYHFDDNEIAFFSNPLGALGVAHNPWELMAAQEDVVFNRKLLAMADTSEDVWGVPEMSLVLSDHATYIKESLENFLSEEYFPSNYFTIGGTVYDTLENAKARYQAAIDWYDDKGIIWISDGPFYLNRFDPEAQYAETIAFRDPTYPFKPGDWYYGRPEVPEVVDVTVPTIAKGITATIGVTMVGPETLAAIYMATDEATGELIFKGEAETTAVYGELEIPLTAAQTDMLDIGGRYVLTIIGKSPDVAFLSTTTKRFSVRDPLLVELGGTVEDITGTIDTLSDRLESTSTDLATAIDAISKLIETVSDDLSSDIADVTGAVSDTNANVSKLVGSVNTLLYAIGATLIIALIGVLTPFFKKS